jgi:hypothetical protein
MSHKSKKKRRGPTREQTRAWRHYYLPPKAWNKICSHCDERPAIAYRQNPRAFACDDCIERLGIKARESKAWREGGSKAGATVTIRHVDPATLRSDRSRSQTRE